VIRIIIIILIGDSLILRLYKMAINRCLVVVRFYNNKRGNKNKIINNNKAIVTTY